MPKKADTKTTFDWTRNADAVLRTQIERGSTLEMIATTLHIGRVIVSQRFDALALSRPDIRSPKEIHPQWHNTAFFARVHREAARKS